MRAEQLVHLNQLLRRTLRCPGRRGFRRTRDGDQKCKSRAQARHAGGKETGRNRRGPVTQDRRPDPLPYAQSGSGQESRPAAPHDPIEDVACDLIDKVGDGKWRTLPEMATAVDVATSVARDGLRRLGADVEARQAPSASNTGSRLMMAGRPRSSRDHRYGRRIADLKARLPPRDAEIDRLKGSSLLDASRPPAKAANEVGSGPQ